MTSVIDTQISRTIKLVESDAKTRWCTADGKIHEYSSPKFSDSLEVRFVHTAGVVVCKMVPRTFKWEPSPKLLAELDEGKV